MMQDFNIQIGKDDYLRIINKGLAAVTGHFSSLIEDGDYISDVKTSRNNKTITLVCKSGRELRVEKAKKKKQRAAA